MESTSRSLGRSCSSWDEVKLDWVNISINVTATVTSSRKNHARDAIRMDQQSNDVPSTKGQKAVYGLEDKLGHPYSGYRSGKALNSLGRPLSKREQGEQASNRHDL